MRKRILISVVSDLSTDQRVHRTALTLSEKGNEVLVTGRKLKSSLPLSTVPYRRKRFSLLFEKGALFYAEYNIRLFFFLLFSKADILVANDLDTLLPNYIISKWKKCSLVYDSHEYFTGVPELEGRKFVHAIWKKIEKMMVPRLSHCITVNDSIAALYRKEYGTDFKVIRNVPLAVTAALDEAKLQKIKSELNPSEKKIILLQGSGINIQRGAEEAVEAMKYLDNALLLIIGAGDVMEKLKAMAAESDLEGKVIFKNKMPADELTYYTRCGDIGLTLDKDLSLNYRYSLPNKLFDYIHAGVPVLASPLHEVKKIVEQYGIGCIIEDHNPKHIAGKITFMLNDEGRIQQWKQNLRKAATELNWNAEVKNFMEVYEPLL